jgi:transcriptional regulator with XRE-family HTH domain
VPIANKLKELREARGWSLQKLASDAGLSISVVHRIERGLEPNPRVNTLKAIARALGVHFTDLVADEPDDDVPPAQTSSRRGRK